MMAEAAVLDQLWTWHWITKGANLSKSLMWGLRLERIKKTRIEDEWETLHAKRNVEYKWENKHGMDRSSWSSSRRNVSLR